LTEAEKQSMALRATQNQRRPEQKESVKFNQPAMWATCSPPKDHHPTIGMAAKRSGHPPRTPLDPFHMHGSVTETDVVIQTRGQARRG
jgi:hypothetical protein